ncbi:MAG TPA: hypothetical protein ENK91_01995, partial [Bacteroidetes bacterium]|nr:hypothetical protein [Bacteroidota bacterium]
MKNLLFITYLISFLLITNYSFAQCPDDPNVTLHTQTDVNNFLEQYPNCTELNNLGFESGDEGDIINDISGFSSLQNLTGRLNIYYTDLTQLTGLNNLEHIYGGLDIYGNNNLGSLLELQTLIDVQEFITINDNPSLPECEAEGICNSLDNVETGFGGNQAGCNSLEEVQEQCSASNCDEFYADADVIPTCYGECTGQITITAGGGTEPYYYDWGDGQTEDNSQSGLCEGTYSITVSDDAGCSTVVENEVTENPELTVTINVSQDIQCNGDCDGSLTANASGGTSPYSYAWEGGEAITQTISNLCAGTFTVTATDDIGCTATAEYTLTEPDELVLSETHINVSCNGYSDGSIDLTVTGGAIGEFAYSYQWSNDETTEDIYDLAAGTYSVTVTDNNGCEKYLSVEITQPDELVLSETHINVTCNGDNDGSIDLTVIGGTPDYSYSWSNGETTEDIYNLAPDTYTVTVTDDNDCTATLSVTITEPDAINLTESHNNVTCNGDNDGSIDLTVTGGTSDYSYSWSSGETTE